MRKQIDYEVQLEWLNRVSEGFEKLIKSEPNGMNKARYIRIKKMIEVSIEEINNTKET